MLRQANLMDSVRLNEYVKNFEGWPQVIGLGTSLSATIFEKEKQVQSCLLHGH